MFELENRAGPIGASQAVPSGARNPSLPWLLIGLGLLAGIVGNAAAQNCYSPGPGTPCSVCPLECSSMSIPGENKDMEIIADPDPLHFDNLLLVTNDGDFRSTFPPPYDDQEILLYQLSSTTGDTPSDPAVIACDYYGHSERNGPEFFVEPDGDLNILYRGRVSDTEPCDSGTGPVHVMASLRPAGAAWNAFGTGEPIKASVPDHYPATQIQQQTGRIPRSTKAATTSGWSSAISASFRGR